jgi:hypothetical protein
MSIHDLMKVLLIKDLIGFCLSLAVCLVFTLVVMVYTCWPRKKKLPVSWRAK